MTERHLTPSLAERLRRGETVHCGWSGLAEPLVAEALARAGFGAVCLDMQHGFQDYRSLREGIAGLAAAGSAPVVRIPFGAYPDIGRVLDLGFEAVICPMVNSVEDARRLAEAAKFPPVGGRSWGPARALMLSGASADGYTDLANRSVVTFAMIETRSAIDALDAILAVEGIDAVFVGPSDLSISLSNGRSVSPESSEVIAAMETIAARTVAAGKIAGAFSPGPAASRRFAGMGYRFIATGADLALFAAAAKRLVEDLNGPAA